MNFDEFDDFDEFDHIFFSIIMHILKEICVWQICSQKWRLEPGSCFTGGGDVISCLPGYFIIASLQWEGFRVLRALKMRLQGCGLGFDV